MRRNMLLPMLCALMPVVYVAIFIGLPIVMGIGFSLGYTGGPNATMALLDQEVITASQGLTLKVYAQLLSNAAFLRDAWSTLWVTALSVGLVLLVGWVLALYIRFTRGWLNTLASMFSIVPMFIPVVIASYALVTFWNANGYASALMAQLFHVHYSGFGYTLFGIAIGQLWTNLPFAVLMLASGLQNVPDTQIEAARDLGASPLRIFLRVIAPLNSLPTLIVGTFTGIGILGSFTVPYVMGPNSPSMLGVTMSRYFTSYNQPQASSAIAVIVFLCAALLGTLYVWGNVRSNKKGGASR